MAGPRPYKPQRERVKKPTFCYQCVAGPDLLTVEEEDGVAVRVESNYAIGDEHPGGGRVCVKAYGLVQKTYNPNRVQSPMKRTNPRKGRNEDPVSFQSPGMRLLTLSPASSTTLVKRASRTSLVSLALLQALAAAALRPNTWAPSLHS